ncbi:sporulation histidine kinase inhibitor Sda [Virgibacillus sp. NKC19-16]|uniref:sporulation histidine kinase inhibitor Sda n=1 Tax=Virgibacillus salidurans TaxID=2831673 RepID=UPI001F391261|nr:sporulation histidine kinase inhibitor Sda [Virgibacillus sp. NKC19-16]UJL46147.1 sporulation histidine kinase inhibitor Sda [Virgibacillus sp. NKC19-16]
MNNLSNALLVEAYHQAKALHLAPDFIELSQLPTTYRPFSPIEVGGLKKAFSCLALVFIDYVGLVITPSDDTLVRCSVQVFNA